jgi:CBS domain containing-hemolysin-like protein
VFLTALFTVGLLILANALYVSAEFGAVGVRRSRIRRLSQDGHGRARRLLPFIEQPAALVRYVSASQIGITLSSLALGAYAQATFGAPLTDSLAGQLKIDAVTARSAAEVVILLGLTAAQVVLGELVPKSLALQYPTEVALFTILPMRWSLAVFRPFAALLNSSALVALRLVGSKGSTHRHLHSPDEIELLIAESRDGGLLEPDEHRRLHRALRLGLRSAGDLMVPLSRLTAVRLDTPWPELMRVVAATPFSRLPVYRGAPDRIVGTLRVKDLVTRFVAEGPLSLDQLIRPIPEIPASLAADRVVGVLRERRAHQAVIADRPGHAVGVITIHDVLDELLGQVTAR